jgi:Egg-laying hormone precursor
MRLIALVVLLCCSLSSTTTNARSTSSHGCRHRGERVVVRSSAGLVVRRSQAERGVPRYESDTETHWWACLVGGLRTYLGRTVSRPGAGGEQGETYGGFRFAGRYLVFHQQLLSNYGKEEEKILEADLRTGRRAVLWSVGGEPLSIPHIDVVDGDWAPVGPALLAVGAQGEVAWVVRDVDGALEVLVHNRLGTHALASYSRTDPESTITGLAISRGRVSWIFNGMTVTATA